MFKKAWELGLEGAVSKRGQQLSQRTKPQLAEDQEPLFRQEATAKPRDAISLDDVLKLTLLVGQSRDNPLSPRP